MAPHGIEDLEGDLIDRAIRAHCTRARRGGHTVDQPSVLDSYTDEADRRAYAVLKNANGVLAVYKLKDDGHIEYVREEDWPGSLGLIEDIETDAGKKEERISGITVTLTKDEIHALVDQCIRAMQKTGGYATCPGTPLATAWDKLAKAVTDPEEWAKREEQLKRSKERQRRQQAQFAAQKAAQARTT
jgi:hypothetical protein